ncbi:Ubiquitin carboxyl-terminal hydrolase 10 [Harpegnathos saltator]|uniref:ubiquitinyl hydrolase 1 n=2 Tax=Harpegnathos saltator TaxID=610380 RepID=E2BN00_HARSA|nr:Ubiquitin carboxyl-terminal hydrolase 10 [Harpegnathos saltator]
MTPYVPSVITNSIVCNESWQSSSMYNVPTNGHMPPAFIHGMAYPSSEYNVVPEVHHDVNYSKDNGRRNNRVKGSRKDNYNHTFNHTNEMQTRYMNDERFLQSVPLYLHVYPEHHTVPPQPPITGQIYYATPIYSQSVHPYTVHSTYSHNITHHPTHNATHHPAHQPDSTFVLQSHSVLPIQDPNPPTTKPLTTSTQQNTCPSAKPTSKQATGDDKKCAHSNTNNGNNKVQPVQKKTTHNIKSSINTNCKVEENSVITDVNIEVNVEVKQNGETENKDEDENVSTVTTTVTESNIKVDEIEMKVEENVTLTNDQTKNIIKRTNDSSVMLNVTSSASVLVDTTSSAKRSWASLFNNTEPKVSSASQITIYNAVPVQNGIIKATEKTTIVASPVATHQNASSNNSSEPKALQNGELEGFYDDPNLFRMGEFLLQYQMNMQTVSLVPRGLTNRNNYCYINSILQALMSCSLFYNLFKAMPHPKNCNKQNKHSTIPSINSLIRFIREFNPLPENARLPRKARANKRDDIIIENGVALEPSYMYTMLKYTSSAGVFPVEGRQEDAEEFLSCLLNAINDEMLDLMKLANNEHNDINNAEKNDGKEEEWRVIGPKNKGSITRSTELERTPLSDIFRGKSRSRVSRPGEQPSDNIQPFFTLQLDIEKADSVKEALDILVSKDRLEGMTCSKTKKQIEAWKQMTLEELPAVLILHLKWFVYKYNGCSKLIKSVEFPIDLKIDNKFLSASTAKKLSPKQKQYKLFAVTYHDGKEATKGHYVTDCFHVGYGTWVRYDDTSAKAISEGTVLKPVPPRVPYLLYYRRCDTIGNNNTHSK